MYGGKLEGLEGHGVSDKYEEKNADGYCDRVVIENLGKKEMVDI